MKGPKGPAQIPPLFILFWKTSAAKERLDGFSAHPQSPMSGRLWIVIVKA